MEHDTHLGARAPESDEAPEAEGQHESDGGGVVEGPVGSAALKGPAAAPTGVDLGQLETERPLAPDQGD